MSSHRQLVNLNAILILAFWISRWQAMKLLKGVIHSLITGMNDDGEKQ